MRFFVVPPVAGLLRMTSGELGFPIDTKWSTSMNKWLAAIFRPSGPSTNVATICNNNTTLVSKSENAYSRKGVH